MPHQTPSRETTFGYLTTLHTPDHGYFGGYLVLSQYGRPLEFHCTSPVRPSRAQEILYGPMLPSYLLGEQISGALLAAAKLTPRLILTDQAATLAVCKRAPAPMVLVLATLGGEDAGTNPSNTRGAIIAAEVFRPAESTISGNGFISGNYELHLPLGYEREQSVVVALLTLLSNHVDLAEPFDRIHEAIREAQRIGAEAQGQAA